MQLIVDANIFVAAFLKSALTRELLFDEELELFAPEYFTIEVAQVIKKSESLALKIPIWSNDSAFKKQSLVKAYTTSELSKLLRI